MPNPRIPDVSMECRVRAIFVSPLAEFYEYAAHFPTPTRSGWATL